ncbi:hypothetical protein PV327_009357 [Microctonus hyperodae]|nr:hypothetical protein PV327_009357 [Microctonus hyperodae]
MNLVISNVNIRLNEAARRYDGFNILMNVLPRCSKELLSKHAPFWISKLIQVLENNQNEIIELTLACRVFARLSISCKEIPELQKQISMQTLKQLVTIILNMEQNKRCGAIFYLLATLMYHYKESSEKSQTSLRKLILPNIDATQKNFVKAGANCFALLAKATERSFKSPSDNPMYTSWTYSQLLICNSLHSIMDDLFSDIMEIETVDVGTKLELSKISDVNLLDYYNRLERRFGNLCIFLSTMLRGCGERNSVCPSDILNVLCRGLAITPTILKTETFKHKILTFILPKLHINLLTILNALIEGFRQELLPYAQTIIKLYKQTLKWTKMYSQQNLNTISSSKPFKSVKKAIYKSLSLWLTHLSNLSAIEIATDEMVPYLLKDITPEKNRVMLTVEKMSCNLSKRALKRFKDSQYENSALLGGAVTRIEKDTMVNADLCVEALSTLENVFYNCASFINLSLCTFTQRLIVSFLYDAYLATDETHFYRKNHSCRHGLLKVLRAIQMNSHPLLLSPIQHSIEIFTLAMNDEKIEIIKDAKLSLTEIEKIVHPCAPTLLHPLSQNQPKKNDLQSEFQDMNEVNLVNDARKECANSIDKLNESINQCDQVRDQRCEKYKNCESITDIANGNCNSPKPSKQRKLEIIDDRGIVSPVDIINSHQSTLINQSNITLNSSIQQLNEQVEKSLGNDDGDNLEISISEYDKILGDFCDEVN